MSPGYDRNERLEYLGDEPHSSSSSPTDPTPPRRPRTGSRASSTKHGPDNAPASSGQRVLARLLAREDRDVRKLNSLLFITTERLDAETQRADSAERRATEFFRRLQSVSGERDRALLDAARVREELELYKMQLDTAQKEIFRAQEIIGRVEAQRNEAEAEAVRERTKARKLQEEKMVVLAKEEGRKMGYEEGLEHGRRLGFQMGRSTGYEDGQGTARQEFEQLLNEEEEEDESNSESHGDIPFAIRMPMTPPPPPPIIFDQPRRSQSARPPSRNTQSRYEHRTYDTALHAPSLPVPTVTTPIPVPSVTHAPVQTPVPVPVHAPDRSPEDIRPIPLHNHEISPVPHPSPIPPDNWIPVSRPGSPYFDVPPAHEMSRPIPSPRTPVQPLQSDILPVPAPVPERTSIRSRDYAYPSGASATPRARTPSRLSRVSQYDIVNPPRNPRPPLSDRDEHSSLHSMFSDDHLSRRDRTVTPRPERQNRDRSQSQTGRAVEEWRSAHNNTPGAETSRRPASRNDRRMVPTQVSRGALHRPREIVLPAPLAPGGRVPPPPPMQPSTSMAANRSPPYSSRPISPLDYLRKRFRNRTESESSPPVPEISVEPPSNSPSNASASSPVSVSQPHLLSPDAANRPLPFPDEVQPQQQLDSSSVGSNVPPLSAPTVLSTSQLPLGFVPLSGPSVNFPSSQGVDYFSHDARTDAMRSRTPQYASGRGASPLVPPSRPPTAGPTRSTSPPSQYTRRRGFSIDSGASPAPLQRPISIFSEEDN